MNKSQKNLFFVFEQILPWVVLAIILIYTYAKFFQQPFVGFKWDGSGSVIFIFTDGNKLSPLQIGDRILQAGSVVFLDHKQDLQKTLIDHVQPGQILQLQVERNGQQVTIPWTIPGPNQKEIDDRLWSEAWLGFAFWLLGTIACLNIRPKDERWKLLMAFNFFTSIWLVVGSGITINHFWLSAVVTRIFVWLSIPVYLHLHWVFPKPLGRLSAAIVKGGYLVTAILAVAQFFQLLPQNLYTLGFLLAIVGSLVLLALHAIRQPDMRKELRVLFFIALLSFAPSIVIGILGNLTTLPAGLGGFGLLSLSLLPMAYVYVVYRRQMSNIEIRFNQALSTYIFLILLMMGLLPVIVLINLLVTGTGSALFMGIMLLIVSALITIFTYRYVQAFIERSILGISLPPRDLIELYSGRITTSTSFAGLQTILESEILPRMYVRQFVFLRVEQGLPQVLQTIGVEAKELFTQNILMFAGPLVGKYQPLETVDTAAPFAWVRLALELKVAGEPMGLWLFGKRDPDDFYSQAEITLLQSLANQTAIALSNIQQTQRVLEMYQQDISRNEQDRMRLALELHDSILNQIASMFLSLDDNAITPEFQSAYDELTGRLRAIVHDLRPAMLNYGLKPALNELVDSLIERDKNGLQIGLELDTDENRYPLEVEQHLFRIVQEACENSLRHGHARKISITGALKPDGINLTIADNGAGFDAGEVFDLANLLANRHFGLAGMLERARMIGGDVKINSSQTTGTRVSFRWALSKS